MEIYEWKPFILHIMNKFLCKQMFGAVNGQGILDYNNINSLRNPSFHQLDIRLDKKYYFKKWSLNIYLDIENVYNKVATLAHISLLREINLVCQLKVQMVHIAPYI